MAGQEQLQRFIEQPRRRHAGQQSAQPRYRCRGRRLERKSELGLEARGAQHAHRILAIARLRIADHAQPVRREILRAADVVPDRKVGDVVVERVDGEIAPPDVLLDAAVDVVAQQPAVRIVHAFDLSTRHVEFGLLVELRRFPVLRIRLRHRLFARRRRAGGAKRRHLDDLAAEHDMRQAKAPPDQARIAKQRPDLIRQRIGGDVEILRMAPEHDVAHAAADQKRLVAGLLQAIEHAQGVAGDIGAGDVVVGAGNDARCRSRWRAAGVISFKSSYPLEQSRATSIIPRLFNASRCRCSLRLEA